MAYSWEFVTSKPVAPTKSKTTRLTAVAANVESTAPYKSVAVTVPWKVIRQVRSPACTIDLIDMRSAKGARRGPGAHGVLQASELTVDGP